MMFKPFPELLTLDLSDSILSSYGWGFQKESELTGFFSFWINRIQENGYLKKVVSRYLPDSRQAASASSDGGGGSEAGQSNIVGFKSTALPVTALAGGMALAAALVLAERVLSLGRAAGEQRAFYEKESLKYQKKKPPHVKQ